MPKRSPPDSKARDSGGEDVLVVPPDDTLRRKLGKGRRMADVLSDDAIARAEAALAMSDPHTPRKK